MKSIMGWALTTALLLFSSFRTIRDPGSYNLEAVATAFRSGNISQLSPYLDIRVDISLPGKTDSYSKSQAELVISDFFNVHGVRTFKVVQQGENAGFIFCTGMLQTYSGNYRTTLFLKQKGERELLQEIRFQSVE